MVESSIENESNVKVESPGRLEKVLSRLALLSMLAATGTSAYTALQESKEKAEYAIAYPVLDDTLLANGFIDVHNLKLNISDNTFSFISRTPSQNEGRSSNDDTFQSCNGSYEYVNYKLSLVFSDIECESDQFIIDTPEDTTTV